MNFAVKTSLGILVLLVFVQADIENTKSNNNFEEQCQTLQCDSSRQVCRINPKCDGKSQDDLSKCVFCAPKDASNQNVAKTLLASSVSLQQQQPIANRLLAKSGDTRLLADSRRPSVTPSSPTSTSNQTSDDSTYDDYYEYDEDEKSDKNEFGEEDEYLDDYTDPIDTAIDGITPIRKPGICPKVVEATGKCDPSKVVQCDCRFDTDCPTDYKCCEAACGARICSASIQTTVSVCPTSFKCSLNCRLGYRTDANGCLLCECQSCPTMDQCNKNCPAGYLKDLFGCDICECSDQCPPFTCNLYCSSDIGFAQSESGCPLCQCATKSTNHIEYTSPCQDDVHCPPGFRCLNDQRNVPICQAAHVLLPPPPPTEQCPTNLADTCALQCTNGGYVLDPKGCPTCACTSDAASPRLDRPPVVCPMYKCRANCGASGYKRDENGCQLCACADPTEAKPRVECSRVMCRMFCQYGFRRNENGCEICACNDAPQVPCQQLDCLRSCPNGYRRDPNGCQSCECDCPPAICPTTCTTTKMTKDDNGCSVCSCDEGPKIDDGCSPMKCALNCKYGFERDNVGCELCSCNKCPLHSCRMFCMYGFRRNNDGCEVCECDWTPIAEKIRCDERTPCYENRVCNLNLKLCELVSNEKVNYFVYDFEVETKLFRDPLFVNTFKKGLIQNIATKYDLEPSQITVSSVETDGMTSFQIMPFYADNLEDFQKKIDQIDDDLNTHEFRSVLPAVTNVVGARNKNQPWWSSFGQKNRSLVLYVFLVLIGLVGLICAAFIILIFRRQIRHPGRSESKSPIFDSDYQQAPTDDDHYHAVHAPDGTAYVVVESEDMQAPNDKRVLV